VRLRPPRTRLSSPLNAIGGFSAPLNGVRRGPAKPIAALGSGNRAAGERLAAHHCIRNGTGARPDHTVPHSLAANERRDAKSVPCNTHSCAPEQAETPKENPALGGSHDPLRALSALAASVRYLVEVRKVHWRKILEGPAVIRDVRRNKA
jgi:hypothetical protein